jgi:TPR repeat protein
MKDLAKAVRRFGRMGLAASALVLAVAPAGAAAEPYGDLERARSLVAGAQFGLARAYLDALVIHPELTGVQRSNAYYYRGFSFLADGFYRSAAQDFMRALDYHTGNAQALMALSHLYANGRGVPHDATEALRLALKAARNEHASGALYVGYAFLTGTGTEPDLARARYWLSAAAAEGLPAALTQLAHSYRSRYSNEPDPEHAVELYRQAIARGADDALVALAYMHLNGEIDPASTQEALGYLQLAADRGHAPALHALAELYRDGTASGTGPDYARAAELCSRAAALGHTPAFAHCAYLYGSEALGDPERAARYLRDGAERGDGFSQIALANLLLGAGSRDAVAEAQHWYRQAAAGGDPLAQNNLAWTLATTRYDDLRNGREAVAAASAAIEQRPMPSYLDTMAAAYAELGDFERARTEQMRALGALPADDERMRAEFSERLASYEKGEPWRE